MLAVPLLAWLACGLAAVCVSPRNLAAVALAGTGVLWPISWALEQAEHQTGADVTFLLGLAGVVGLLLVYPSGRFDASWHAYVVGGFLVLAVVGPLASAADSPTVAAVGEAVVLSEPLWVLTAVGVLVLRFASGPAELRRELAPVLAGIAVLALALVVIVSTSVSRVGVPGFVGPVVFLPALALLPVVLLWGISRRTRVLDRELAASRTRLSEAEDRVRRQIERDLHDGVQQQLVAILSLTELATRQVGRHPDAATETLTDVRDQVAAAITDLRELVHGIRPPVLEDAGVAAALSSRLDRLPPGVSLRTDLGHRTRTGSGGRPRSRRRRTSSCARPSRTPSSTQAPPRSTSRWSRATPSWRSRWSMTDPGRDDPTGRGAGRAAGPGRVAGRPVRGGCRECWRHLGPSRLHARLLP